MIDILIHGLNIRQGGSGIVGAHDYSYSRNDCVGWGKRPDFEHYGLNVDDALDFSGTDRYVVDRSGGLHARYSLNSVHQFARRSGSELCVLLVQHYVHGEGRWGKALVFTLHSQIAANQKSGAGQQNY